MRSQPDPRCVRASRSMGWVMEFEAIATGGGSAALVWLLLKVLGRWATKHRWTVTIQSLAMDAMAKKLEEERQRRTEAEAVARVCRAHMDRHLGGRENERDPSK